MIMQHVLHRTYRILALKLGVSVSAMLVDTRQIE